MLAAWRKIGAFPLTRARLAHPKVRSVASGQGPDSEKLEGLAKRHRQRQTAVTAAGFNSTSCGTAPTHTHAARPSSEEEQIAELVRLGSISTKKTPGCLRSRRFQLWRGHEGAGGHTCESW